MPDTKKRKVTEAALDEEPVDVDWSAYKVTELKIELEKRGLSKAGNKSELVQRLYDSDAAEVPTRLSTSPIM
jgi:hypothetical protein